RFPVDAFQPEFGHVVRDQEAEPFSVPGRPVRVEDHPPAVRCAAQMAPDEGDHLAVPLNAGDTAGPRLGHQLDREHLSTASELQSGATHCSDRRVRGPRRSGGPGSTSGAETKGDSAGNETAPGEFRDEHGYLQGDLQGPVSDPGHHSSPGTIRIRPVAWWRV